MASFRREGSAQKAEHHGRTHRPSSRLACIRILTLVRRNHHVCLSLCRKNERAVVGDRHCMVFRHRGSSNLILPVTPRQSDAVLAAGWRWPQRARSRADRSCAHVPSPQIGEPETRLLLKGDEDERALGNSSYRGRTTRREHARGAILRGLGVRGGCRAAIGAEPTEEEAFEMGH